MINLKEYCTEKISLVVMFAVNAVSSLLITLIIGASIWALHWFFQFIGMETSSIYQVITQLSEIEAICFFIIFIAMSIHTVWKAYCQGKEKVE